MERRRPGLGWLLLLLPACRTGDPEPPPEPTPEEIRAQVDADLASLYTRFEQAYARADADAIAEIYHPAGWYLAPREDLIQGRAAIRDHFGRFLDGFRGAERPGPELTFEVVDRQVAGDFAYDIGYYTLRPPWADEDDPGGRGKFLVVWTRVEDGGWLMLAEAFSDLD
jgi:ketosteroid isomerase-like protein